MRSDDIILIRMYVIFKSHTSQETVKIYFPGCQQNAALRKSWEIQAYSVTKRRTLSEQKVVYRKMFSCSNPSDIWK